MSASTIFLEWDKKLKAINPTFTVYTENVKWPSTYHTNSRVTVRADRLSINFTYCDFPGGCGVCLLYGYSHEGDNNLFVQAMNIFAELVKEIDTSGGLVACNPINSRGNVFLKLAGFTPMFSWNNSRHGERWNATLWFRICDDRNQPLKSIPTETSYKLVDKGTSLMTHLLQGKPDLIKM